MLGSLVFLFKGKTELNCNQSLDLPFVSVLMKSRVLQGRLHHHPAHSVDVVCLQSCPAWRAYPGATSGCLQMISMGEHQLPAMSDPFLCWCAPSYATGERAGLYLESYSQSHPYSRVFVTSDGAISVKNAACSLRSQDEFAVLTAREIIS